MSMLSMRRAASQRLAKLTIAVALLLCGGMVHAEVRSFVVLEIRGPGGDRFARQIEGDLADLYSRVSSSAYQRAAQDLDAPGPTPAEVAKVATRIHADVVIVGAVVDDGSATARLLIVVRDGKTGDIAARFRFPLVGWTLPGLREKVGSTLVRAFDRIRPGFPSPPELLAAGAKPTPQPKLPDSDDDDTPDPHANADANADAAIVDRAAPATSAQWAARSVYAGVGPAVISRSLRFDSAAALSYGGGAAFGVRVDGAVFPFALTPEWVARHPVLATIGFAGMYEHVFGVGAVGGPAQVATTAHGSRWQAQLVSRIPLGKEARGGTLTIEATFQELSWVFDDAALGVPNTSLDLLGAGLGWEHTLGTPRLSLGLRAAVLGMISGGALTSETQYGRAGGVAVDLEAGLTARPTAWLWLRLSGRYSPTVISFAGSGARFAKQAVDQWADGVLEVGFAL